MTYREHGLKLNRALNLIEEFRKIDPDMPLQTAACFLLIAQEPGISIMELSTRMGMAQSTASRNVAVLSEYQKGTKKGHGLVVSKEDPLERRRKLVTLSPKGRRVAESLEGIKVHTHS